MLTPKMSVPTRLVSLDVSVAPQCIPELGETLHFPCVSRERVDSTEDNAHCQGWPISVMSHKQARFHQNSHSTNFITRSKQTKQKLPAEAVPEELKLELSKC